MLERLVSFDRKGTEGLRQIAFYGGSFTGLPLSTQEAYLRTARRFIEEGKVDSLRVSARPDELSQGSICFLYSHGVRTIEVGVQSLCDEVLEKARRGHSAADAVGALARVREAGIEVGAQLMVGLPGDTRDGALETARGIIQAKVDFVRLYPVLVMRGTDLEDLYAHGWYRPLEIDEAVDLCKELVVRFEEACIRVIRIGLHNERHLTDGGGLCRAGPFHPAFGDLVRSAIFFDKVAGLLASMPLPQKVVCLSVHPQDRPLLHGHKNENIVRLMRRFDLEGIRVLSDPCLPRGTVGYGEISLSTPEGPKA